jgi:hypothetical protein
VLEGLTQPLSQEVDIGVTFLIVEPGAFRTGLFNPGAAYTSAPMPEYAATVGPTREYLRSGDGTQPGDPAKAAQAILTALEAPDPPLRLVFGGDAIDTIRNRLESLARNWADGRQSGARQPLAVMPRTGARARIAHQYRGARRRRPPRQRLAELPERTTDQWVADAHNDCSGTT